MKKWVLACLLVMVNGLAVAAPKALLLGAPPVQLGKLENLQPIALAQGIELDYRMLESSATLTPKDLQNYDYLMIDAAYGPAVAMLQQQLLPSLKSTKLPWLWLRRDGHHSQALPADVVAKLDRYYSNGGPANYAGYFCTLAAFLKQAEANCADAKLYPEYAIYHPEAQGEVFSSLKDYLIFRTSGLLPKTVAAAGKPLVNADGSSSATKLAKHNDQVAQPQVAVPDHALRAFGIDRPVIGIVFHKSYMDSGLTELLNQTIAGIEARGGLAVPIYASAMKSGQITELVTYQGKPRLDVLLNMQIMLNSAARKAEFETLGVPVLQVINYHQGEQAEWEKDPIGLTPMDIPFYLSEPEYAGLIDPIVASASAKNDNLVPISRQLDAVLNKASNLARLRHTPAQEIKTAIFFYNYPPGEKNLGASFLNVPRSLETLLAAYKKRGYDTRTLTEDELIDALSGLLAPFYRPEKLAQLVKTGKAGRLPVATYQAWFQTLPKPTQAAINERWGSAEKASLVLSGGDYFAIPALMLGKQIILPQPPRSEREADKEQQLYHDTKTPPSHSYLATYLWLKEVVKVDALVHFGTHGSQEWQPGKERGLDVNDYPLLTLGDIPVLYPYIVDNIGEALQTKRRGRATVISHNTPSFGPAGLHHQLTTLHDLLHQWQNLTEGDVRNQIVKRIKDLAKEQKMDKDLGLDLDQQNFADSVKQLHLHLHDLALTNQPLGLARFGVGAEDDLRLLTVQQMLGRPLLTALSPADPEELLLVDYEELKNTPVWTWLVRHVRESKAVNGNEQLKALAVTGREFWALLGNNQELKGFFTALSGGYVHSSYGGDPIKNHDSLPTGRNLYGFDPSRIPTVEAWEAGKLAGAKLLEQHKEQNGAYPTKLAFTLWSVETMRHLGMLEAQAFYLMGYKPIWGQGGRITGIEKIPAAELGRPRVDVVISATGLYRDHFPQVMKWLAQAAKAASELNEPNNPIRANSLAIEKTLLAKGMSQADARLGGQTRIFSSESGAYSTGLEDAIGESASFGETQNGKQNRQAGEAKLAALYLERMQFAYGPDESRWGEKTQINVYREQLKGVEGAVLSRSSNLYGMLTTDDPFQYLGGIGLAVRHLTGKSPSLYISNLRDERNTRAETAAGFLARDLRTRYLHPGWIKNMQQEGYSGALEILGSANNLWGWQVVSPDVVRDDQWQEYKAVYVDDKYQLDINNWFEQNHPQAQAQLIERMLEAARKEYWRTDAKTLQDLAERYQTLAEKYDVRTDNQRFKDFVAQAAGYGLSANAAPTVAQIQPPQSDAAQAQPVQQVQGQKLEQQTPPAVTQPQPFDWIALAGLALVLLAFSSGMLQQARVGRAFGVTH